MKFRLTLEESILVFFRSYKDIDQATWKKIILDVGGTKVDAETNVYIICHKTRLVARILC